MKKAFLEVRDLFFGYGSKEVLKGVSFDTEGGRVCGIFGPNGGGKSTLFKCCLNFLSPSSGSVAFNGADSRGFGVSKMARTVSYVPQEHKSLFPFTVREIVLMGRSPRMGGIFGISAKDLDAAEQAMDTLGISFLADIPVTRLSGGQRQLAFIARAVAQEAPFMFLDEPTSSLDFSNQIMIWNTLKKIAGAGAAVLVCSHDPNHILWFCDTAVAVSEGRVAAKGAAEDVLTGPLLSSVYGGRYKVAETEGRKIICPEF